MLTLNLGQYPPLERYSIAVFSFVFILAGIAHMIAPELAVDYMPDWIPGAWYWVFWTGPTEIIGGIALLTKRYRHYGAWFLQLHLVGYLLLHGWHVWIGGELPSGVEPIPLGIVWVRLLFQFVLIWLMARIIAQTDVAAGGRD